MIDSLSVTKGISQLAADIAIDGYVVNEVRHLPGDAYILRFERNDLEFQPGQHIQLAPKDDFNYREYSIYSNVHDDFLEVLVKEISNGYLSKKLEKSKPGDVLEILGPFGHFTIRESNITKPILFIASGTGIAPFHSIISSNPNLDYTILHGVRHHFEAYERESYDQKRYILCTTRDDKGLYHGRVTGYLSENNFDLESEVYLCGNNNMIFDAVKILNQKGFKREQIHTEVYF